MMLFTDKLQSVAPQISATLLDATNQSRVEKESSNGVHVDWKLGGEVGEKYGVKIIVNFPGRERINEFDMYGRRDISRVKLGFL